MKRTKAYAKAAKLGESFTGHKAIPTARTRVTVPTVMFAVGTCDFIGYTTVRDGETEKYQHKFKPKSKPVLAVSPDGLQLFLVGGSFRFTDRGIDDDA